MRLELVTWWSRVSFVSLHFLISSRLIVPKGFRVSEHGSVSLARLPGTGFEDAVFQENRLDVLSTGNARLGQAEISFNSIFDANMWLVK